MSTKRVNAFLQLEEQDFSQYYGNGTDKGSCTGDDDLDRTTGDARCDGGSDSSDGAGAPGDDGTAIVVDGQCSVSETTASRDVVVGPSLMSEAAKDVSVDPGLCCTSVTAAVSETAAVSCVISIRRGCFTWTQEGKSGADAEGQQVPASTGNAEVVEENSNCTIPWGLTDINITIHSVRG